MWWGMPVILLQSTHDLGHVIVKLGFKSFTMSYLLMKHKFTGESNYILITMLLSFVKHSGSKLLIAAITAEPEWFEEYTFIIIGKGTQVLVQNSLQKETFTGLHECAGHIYWEICLLHSRRAES